MSDKKKIFVLLPDGIGLRNFAYTNFYKIGLEKEFDITFWNATPFDLSVLGFKEIKIVNPKTHPLTDFYKNAQIQIELNENSKRANDNVYDSYRFPFSGKTFKDRIKKTYIRWLIFTHNSQKGLNSIKNKISQNERKTKGYFDSLATLQAEKPAMVFCTNQRVILAKAPLLAAQDLGITTATFIFSWDNLPKGVKIVETDYYFVWSEHMKHELQYYYPYIGEDQIFVTGSPQFEPHFDPLLLLSKETFFKNYQLDIAKKYICFSGDDTTTSPNDPQYLNNVAQAINILNAKGYNLGIIFRRCPVDFSNRYDAVLEAHKTTIVSIQPQWEKVGESWNAILPTKKDLELQMNTIYHSELVINLGSSMVFDYAAFSKPCGFINYDVVNEKFPNWSVEKIYNFIHFRSMPNNDCVYWLNNPNGIALQIENMLNKNDASVVTNAQKWFKKINQHPPEKASERIWDAIGKIISK